MPKNRPFSTGERWGRRPISWRDLLRRAAQGVLLVLILVPGVSGQNGGLAPGQVVLAYDDGIPTLTLRFLENAGTVFAVRFTPPEGQVQLTEVRYFVPDTSEGATFTLRVTSESSGEPGATLLGPLSLRARQTGWNAVSLSEHELMLQGDFFVLLEYDGSSRLALGAENRAPLSNRTYDTDC